MQVLSETLRLSSFMQWLLREANNDIDINGAFLFCPLTCVLSFCLQNLLSYLTWIGKYGHVYITCHEAVGFHWHDSRWRKGGRCLWICIMDIMIQLFSKTHWSLNPFGLKWVVCKPKENIVGHNKERSSL
jgi:hypothetical protein